MTIYCTSIVTMVMEAIHYAAVYFHTLHLACNVITQAMLRILITCNIFTPESKGKCHCIQVCHITLATVNWHPETLANIGSDYFDEINQDTYYQC